MIEYFKSGVPDYDQAVVRLLIFKWNVSPKDAWYWTLKSIDDWRKL